MSLETQDVEVLNSDGLVSVQFHIIRYLFIRGFDFKLRLFAYISTHIFMLIIFYAMS